MYTIAVLAYVQFPASKQHQARINLWTKIIVAKCQFCEHDDGMPTTILLHAAKYK